MTQLGWVLFFGQPSGLDDLPDNDAYLAARRAYITQRIKQVESLLVNGLRFASVQEYIGTACVVGPDDQCLQLKQQVEEMGMTMIPNTDCLRPA